MNASIHVYSAVLYTTVSVYTTILIAVTYA